jgi:hypothetical protein
MSYHNAHAAKIENGVVTEVIVIPRQEDDRDDLITAYCNSIGLEGVYIDTSYLGSRRGKYAAIGDRYDADLDEFISPLLEAPTE